MNERAIAVRVSTVSLLVPGCAGLTYALVVPAFLGREESARAALLQVTLAATAGLALALTVLSFGYLPAIFRAARALRTSGEALDEPSLARLYAAPRGRGPGGSRRTAP